MLGNYDKNNKKNPASFRFEDMRAQKVKVNFKLIALIRELCQACF
jgi:hypothetical protein